MDLTSPLLSRPPAVRAAPPVAAGPRRGYFLRPLTTGRQRWTIRIFGLVWAAALVWFWSWWLSSPHLVTVVGMVLTSAMLVLLTLPPAWLLLVSIRVSVPRDDLELPELRVAMVVTKTPLATWPVVRRTLEAMLGQTGVGDYDVWLADEDPGAETARWCRAKGVGLVTRKNAPDYHRPSWPRRTHSKEGNLAYFYDTVGYERYDVVCQFDADHAPSPRYLRRVLEGFADARVGYVAAPSIGDVNADRSWAARGRLHREATLRGVLQAGQNDRYAPTCIGSHYAVRTAALRQIGGVGPELAEDFSTSFLLHAHGWKGVFALDAIANGDGPETFADAMTQELQWSRSLTLFFLRYAPGHWRNLEPPERVRLTWAQIWNPTFALQMVIGFAFPLVALVSGVPWVPIDLIEYLLRASVPGFALLAFVMWLRSAGWMRPSNPPVLSWEMFLFQLTRWPWVAAGVVQAGLGALTGREFSFRVTPKGRSGAAVLPLRAVVPYAVLSMLSSAGALALGHREAVGGYAVLCVVNAAVYGGITLAVPLLHYRESSAAAGVRAALAIALGCLSVAAVAGVARADLAAAIVSVRSLSVDSDHGMAMLVCLAALTALLWWRVLLPDPPEATPGSPPSPVGTAVAGDEVTAPPPEEGEWMQWLAQAVLVHDAMRHQPGDGVAQVSRWSAAGG